MAEQNGTQLQRGAEGASRREKGLSRRRAKNSGRREGSVSECRVATGVR